MDLTSPTNIKTLLNKYGAKPSKSLGQNFLIDKNVLEKIIQTANLKPDDTVLEIGPGVGTLTQELAKTAGKIISVEKDTIMCKILAETLKGYENTEVIYGDILKFKNLKIILKIQKFKNYKIIANIPYYITSPLIRKFLEAEKKPDFMVLMVQKEVAQRICAKPPNMSLLAVSVQFYAEPKIINYVSKSCFWPSPKVDSAIIKIIPHIAREFPAREFPVFAFREYRELFFRVVKAGFAHPRKQLAGNLLTLSRAEGFPKLTKEKTAEWLAKNKIDPKQRAETLSIEDWKNLTKTALTVI